MSVETMDREAGARDEVQFVEPGDGESIWFNQGLVDIKITGEWSKGAFSMAEIEMERGRATALHTDPSLEIFYVLEGELRFHVEGSGQRKVPAGGTIAIHPGVVHAFITASDRARFIVMHTPGTHDRFFRESGYPASDRDFSKAPPPDAERTRAAGERIGAEFLGPAPFDEVRYQSG